VETTAVGAAYLAGLATGFWRNPNELEGAWQRDRGFSPTMGATERERLYTGWKRAVSQVRSSRKDDTW
jgi:glycerol kinase